MAEVWRHAGALIIGTTAERGAFDTSVLRRGNLWFDTDLDAVLLWDGAAWAHRFADPVEMGDGTNYTEVKSDGEINLHGTARVTKYTWMSASATRAAGAKPATIGLNGSGWIVASFADGQEEQIQANIMIPPDADPDANIAICIGWSSPTISQNCDWEVTYLVTAANEDTDQAGVLVQSFEASSAVADGLVISALGNIDIDSGDVCVHVVVERDGNDVLDTLGDVAEVHGLALRYTADKLGAAT
jgi:hypothetical protein